MEPVCANHYHHKYYTDVKGILCGDSLFEDYGELFDDPYICDECGLPHNHKKAMDAMKDVVYDHDDGEYSSTSGEDSEELEDFVEDVYFNGENVTVEALEDLFGKGKITRMEKTENHHLQT